MGSAPFAVPCLEALAESRHKVIEVVAQPCKPAGRGMHMRECAVALFAHEAGLPLFQPKGVRKPEVLDHFKKLAPDLIVVVAYGKLLPRELIDIPPMGCVNVHASLLPKYRGAAPINWAIAGGEQTTGVTTMFIGEELDAGDVLLSASTPIDPCETASMLHDRLADMGADVLMQTIEGLVEGTLKGVPQNDAQASFAPIMKKGDGHIDWTRSAAEIYDRIRAFTPWPGSFTLLHGKKLRVHEAAPVECQHGKKPGTIILAQDGLSVACGKDALYILEIQVEGGKRMPTAHFLRGHKLKEGDAFT